MVRRFLLLLLVVLLPAQFAWAAVTSYCGHESGAASQHFGHHEHVHKAEKSSAGDSKPGADNDCGTCHSASAPAITGPGAALVTFPAAQAPLVDPVPQPPSIVPDRPDRPQWPRLA